MPNISDEGKKFFLSACLIAKNEGRYLLEWIAFHKAVGFDHFYIYDNDSSDDTRSILINLQKHGWCTYTHWPRSAFPDNPQVNAYRHMISEYHRETSWVAIIDADEFVIPLTSDRVDEVLRNKFSNAASVLCNWRVFGSSGYDEDDGRFCIERFRRSSAVGYHSNNHVKAICRPDLVEIAFVHNHYMKNGPIVLSDGSNMSPARNQLTTTPVYEHLQINHYFCKSFAEFSKKRNKGLAELPLDHPMATRSMEMFSDADRNEVENNSAYVFFDKMIECYRQIELMCATDIDKGNASSI
ncbi:glycosyltransferase family 2 protein [Methylorubrum sp. B1-46]|uniref:glycosyltransferase family 2 protein n=1 Tax=Methylorubrum sp. B1-46 TaxID=2897334 RepID=UPI001E4C6B2A|nr:glycosyltransferase family 2 protein [Methylorubrum sp. B1-46]UGB24876.1 glycosyltransferase family 2 protein [Methylorubrum sp. B1-46]